MNLWKLKAEGVKTVGITAYDYPFSKMITSTGKVDFIVVGDTVGSTVYGVPDLNRVTMETMIAHCEAVARGSTRPFLIGDLPFMSYQACTKLCVENSGRLIRTGMDAVKLEGFYPEHIKAVNDAGMIAMAHLGLTPMTRAKLGGYKIQAKTSDEIDKLVSQSVAIEAAGASLLLLEAVPDDVGEIVTKELKIPVYGIGAGNKVDGQVVILHDLLGMFWDFKPKFIKQYTNLEKSVCDAIQEYADDVVAQKFPSEEFFYHLNHAELERYLAKKQWKYTAEADEVSQ